MGSRAKWITRRWKRTAAGMAADEQLDEFRFVEPVIDPWNDWWPVWEDDDLYGTWPWRPLKPALTEARSVKETGLEF